MGNFKMVFWCIVLLTISESFVRVHSQTPSTKGFISIDCGIANNTNLVDSFTGLTYVSDDKYTDTGINHEISSEYPIDDTYKYLLTLRSFPNFTKNCYTLTPVTKGNKYLVRATFLYGNYDGLKEVPIFDVYLGINFWLTVNLTLPDYFYYYEIITIAPDDYIQVCLVNTGSGTPLISALELRPLKTTMYAYVNSTQSLDLFFRDNFGSSNNTLVRYPDDPYDRQWFNNSDASWTEISTTSIIPATDEDFETPSAVLQTAVQPISNNSFDLSWTSDNTSTTFFIVLHISEIESLTSKDLREFDIYANGLKLFDNATVPAYLDSYWATYTHTSDTNYNMSLVSTVRSTLPPIINAVEVYTVVPVILLPTETHDVTAINAIKENYSVTKGWSGDPCVPTGLGWTGVICTLTSSNVPRIISLNLTSSELTGAIVSAFGDLTMLKSLDLSRNKLSGSIPSSLDQLTSLTFLDLSGNTKLSTTLPRGLQKRKDNGLLTVKTKDDSSHRSSGYDKKKSPIIITMVIVIAMVVVLVE